MKRNLKGICAVSMVLSLLVATFTACGKKIEQTPSVPENSANANVSIIQDGTTNSNNNYTTADSVNNDNGFGGYSGGSSSDNSSSGGSYSGGGSSSGGYSGGGSSSGGYSGGGSSSDGSSDITLITEGTTGKTSFRERFKRTTTTTTASGPKTTRVPTSQKVNPEKVLNSAKLNPMLTNDPELDAQVEEILAKTTNSKMSTYDKVRSVYDYLVRSNRYGGSMHINLKTRYYSPYDSDVVGRSKAILRYQTGNCVDFSAAFMAITRRIGLDCYLVTGQILNKYGESSFHGWNIIKINGVDYGFDSEGDFRAADSGKSETKYYIFCVVDPVKFDEKYTKIAVASFGKFRTF